MLFFQDGPDGKKTYCCGCSLACGLLAFSTLAGLGGVSEIAKGFWIQGSSDVLACVLGYLAVFSKQTAIWAVINWWVYVVKLAVYVVVLIVIALFGGAILSDMCEEGGVSQEECDAAGGLVWVVILVMVFIGGPIIYFSMGIAYFYIAEKKAELDSNYSKA